MTTIEDSEEKYPIGHPMWGAEPSEIWLFENPLYKSGLVRKFGVDSLVQAAEEPEKIRALLSEGTTITPYAMYAAADHLQLETLELLLDAGASPNMRLDADTAQMRRDTKDLERFQYLFRVDWFEWYPLVFAAFAATRRSEREARHPAMKLLLTRGADPYGVFQQYISVPRYGLFPGEEDVIHGKSNSVQDPVD